MNHLSTTQLIAQVLLWIMGDHPAVSISGDSGSGKSVTMGGILTELIRRGQQVILIDPPGDLAKLVIKHVVRMSKSIQQRVIIIKPADIANMISLNPLTRPQGVVDDLVWLALLTTIVGNVSNILLTSWGESGTDSRPRLFTWLTRVLKTLGHCGLTLPDAKHLLDVGSPVFHKIIRSIPDPFVKRQFEELAEMKPREAGELIDSTRTRLLGFLENPIIEAFLGQSENALSMEDIIESGVSVIVDLEGLGRMRLEDKRIIANLILTTFLHTVVNLPQSKRPQQIVLALDELPIFASACETQLITCLRENRKYNIKLMAGFQGTSGFEGGADNQLLQTLLSQSGAIIAHRHSAVPDAKLLGEMFALPAYDPWSVKHEQIIEVQQQDGHKRIQIDEKSETTTSQKSKGGSDSSTTTDARNWASQTTASTTTGDSSSTTFDLLRDTIGKSQQDARSRQSGGGGSESTANQKGNNWAEMFGKSKTVSHKIHLVPKQILKKQTTGIQFLSYEEQSLIQASNLARMQTGTALVMVKGAGIQEIHFPMLHDPFKLCPKSGAKQLQRFYERLHALPLYASAQEILEEREEFLRLLCLHLDQNQIDSSTGLILPISDEEPVTEDQSQKQQENPSQADEQNESTQKLPEDDDNEDDPDSLLEI